MSSHSALASHSLASHTRGALPPSHFLSARRARSPPRGAPSMHSIPMLHTRDALSRFADEHPVFPSGHPTTAFRSATLSDSPRIGSSFLSSVDRDAFVPIAPVEGMRPGRRTLLHHDSGVALSPRHHELVAAHLAQRAAPTVRPLRLSALSPRTGASDLGSPQSPQSPRSDRIGEIISPRDLGGRKKLFERHALVDDILYGRDLSGRAVADAPEDSPRAHGRRNLFDASRADLSPVTWLADARRPPAMARHPEGSSVSDWSEIASGSVSMRLPR